MSTYPPRADLEITEWRTDGPEAAFVVPFEARLNGQELAIPNGHPVKIHDVSLAGDQVFLVTLTIMVTSLTVASRNPEETKSEMARRGGEDSRRQRAEDSRRRFTNLGLVPESAPTPEVSS